MRTSRIITSDCHLILFFVFLFQKLLRFKKYNTFATGFDFYCKRMLAPQPYPKLYDQLLTAVRDCWLAQHIHSQLLYLEVVSTLRNPRTRHAVVTRDGVNKMLRRYCKYSLASVSSRREGQLVGSVITSSCHVAKSLVPDVLG